jgi:hypothetical protein
LPLHCKFTQDNPVEYERASSYDLNDLVDKYDPNDLLDKVGAFDCADQSDNDKWDLPQLDTDEKTGPKVLNKLAAAINIGVSKRSVKDAINTIAKKYARPDNCTNLCAPRVNSEI